MHDFYNGKYDILISTTIIESGLDIPAANTIFIHRSDMFGLSALYQLRGRVGRGSAKAYAYLLLPNNKTLSKIATKRLEVMQTLDSLGVGFSIATHDMDIRGFGNLLGDEQSGHVREVGVELYQNMLKSTIDELKNEVKQDLTSWSPQINIGIPVLIPEAYISDIHVRMGIYRRVATLASNAEIEEFKAELIDRFGKYPEDIENLFTIVALKILCKKANIEKIDAGEKGVVVAFRENKFSNPEKLLTFAMNSGYIKVRPDEKIVFVRTHTDIIKRVAFAFACVNQIIALQ
jgi:transcription-repair coupling factor (superfamily II helicase)